MTMMMKMRDTLDIKAAPDMACLMMIKILSLEAIDIDISVILTIFKTLAQ